MPVMKARSASFVIAGLADLDQQLHHSSAQGGHLQQRRTGRVAAFAAGCQQQQR
jgi:hypothetical protein